MPSVKPMTTAKQVLAELKKHGNEQTRKTYARHGVTQPVFGVKVADLKVIAKKIKGEQQLALDLYDTGNYDAMYLAGLVADGSQMTKKQLEAWLRAADARMIWEYTVPWVASESPHARGLAMKWIKAKREATAAAGWNTYAGIVGTRPDDELDLDEIAGLLDHIVDHIGGAANFARYTMNGFVIAVGGYVKPLLKRAKAAAKQIGAVEVDLGDTACKVPLATDYLKKMESAGRIGRKRKTLRC